MNGTSEAPNRISYDTQVSPSNTGNPVGETILPFRQWSVYLRQPIHIFEPPNVNVSINGSESGLNEVEQLVSNWIMVPVLKYTHILVHKGAHDLGDFRKCSYAYQAINLVEPLKQTKKQKKI